MSTEPYFQSTRWFALSVISAIVGLMSLILGIMSVHHIDNYELGFTFDRFSGKIERLERSGLVFKPIWHYSVHRLDLRPKQVSISANARILNAKLVRFNPEGLETFVEWHGRDAGDEDDSLYEILKSYAFNINNGADCPFLIIVDEMRPNKTTVSSPAENTVNPSN